MLKPPKLGGVDVAPPRKGAEAGEFPRDALVQGDALFGHAGGQERRGASEIHNVHGVLVKETRDPVCQVNDGDRIADEERQVDVTGAIRRFSRDRSEKDDEPQERIFSKRLEVCPDGVRRPRAA